MERMDLFIKSILGAHFEGFTRFRRLRQDRNNIPAPFGCRPTSDFHTHCETPKNIRKVWVMFRQFLLYIYGDNMLKSSVILGCFNLNV